MDAAVDVTDPMLDVPKLNLDVRLLIWQVLYAIEDSRIVEVRTLDHNDCWDHGPWCPIYSPSPAPLVANICMESRQKALKVAKKAGHLLLLNVQPDFPVIYFNPSIDILSVLDPYFDGWFDTPCNIVRQLSKTWVSEKLVKVALHHDILLERNVHDRFSAFQNLRELIVVVTPKATHFIDAARASLVQLAIAERSHQIADKRSRGVEIPGPDKLAICHLAVKRGRSFQYILDDSRDF
jgi:hypothetical protein